MFKLLIGLVLVLAAIVAYFYLNNPLNAPQPKRRAGKLVEPIVKELPSKKPADSYTEDERKELNQIFQ